MQARRLLAARRGLSQAAEALKFRFEFSKPAVEVCKGLSIAPLSCVPETTALDAAATMTAENRHHMLVMSEKTGRLAGLLTERDFLTKLPLARGAARATKVSELMTPAYDLVTGSASCSFEQVVRRMRKERISSFPLVDDEGRTTSVVTKKQIAQQIFNALEAGLKENLDGADVDVGAMLDYHANRSREADVRGVACSLPPYVSVAEAVELMRAEDSGSLSIFAPPFATHSHFVLANNFGLFTEREYVNALHLFDDRAPEDVELFEVARFSQGKSKKTMQKIHEQEGVAGSSILKKPEAVVAVQRSTPVRDCLSLMLGNGLLFVPVTEDRKPVDVVSLRDINLFLVPKVQELST